MKLFVVLALAAAVSADPQMFYNTGLYNGYTGLWGNGYYGHHGLTYHASSPGVSHTVGLHKRDAEAYSPYFYGAHTYAPSVYSHGVYAPSVYSAGVYAHPTATYGIKANAGTYSNDAVSAWNYAAKGRYVASSAGATHIAKRDADAQYYGYAMPAMYSHTYAPVSYAAPVHYAAPIAHPVAVPAMKTYSNDAVKPFNYASKGQYHADSLGAKHIAKRDAQYFPATAYTTGYSSFSPYTRTSVHVPTFNAVKSNGQPLRYIKYFH